MASYLVHLSDLVASAPRASLIADMAYSTEPTMIDLEQELADSIADRRDSRGQPLAGLFNLTRRMEDENDEQFHVDLTIMDFLTYKATEAVFEWRAGPNPHHSDLPSALVTMTDGRVQFISLWFLLILLIPSRVEDLSQTQTHRTPP